MFGHTSEADKLILLYKLETQDGSMLDPVEDISDEESRFIRTSGEYILWESTKRDFDYKEVANSRWLETSGNGQAAKLDCLKTRGAILCPLIGNQLIGSKQFRGEWYIHNGLLRMNVESGDNKFDLLSVANDTGRIHSLLLFKNKQLQGTANITLMS